MKEYVLGFLFSPDKKEVLLLKKEKPAWQKDMWNGVGGKVEEGEASIQAMAREFEEEAGVQIDTWIAFAEMSGTGWHIDCFHAVSENIWKAFPQVAEDGETTEDVHVFPVGNIPQNIVAEVAWLVPLALNSTAESGPMFTEIYF